MFRKEHKKPNSQEQETGDNTSTLENRWGLTCWAKPGSEKAEWLAHGYFLTNLHTN